MLGHNYDYQYYVLVDEYFSPTEKWYEKFLTKVLKHLKSKKLETYDPRKGIRLYTADGFSASKELWAECEKYAVGLDRSGGIPALFVVAKSYKKSGRARKYSIKKDAENLLGSIVSMGAPGRFRRTQSPYTSEVIEQYP
mgnify:CR=1 FL=1|tara:strand:+ start:7468 stop:7884 length:417 start_codon:yes stop_codon:yes gene_type:complete